MKVGVVIASTGGYKLARCMTTLQAMEPSIELHATVATNTHTYQMLRYTELIIPDSRIRYVEPSGFVNGGMNVAIRWMRERGYDAACVLHDDLVFSPLPGHRGSLSQWFTREWSECSGITFAHFECLTSDRDMRRTPHRWDAEDLSDPDLWVDLQTFDRMHNGSPVYPRNRDWFVRYEGTDRYRPWNRLGPTGYIIPIALWERFNGFDERYGCFYDHDYPANCFRANLPPIYAAPNAPWLHLHNQSVNPWADPAIGLWGDSDGAFARKFGAILTDFWHTNWEERWLAREPFSLQNSTR